MKNILLAIILIGFLPATIVHADTGWFAGGGAGLINLDNGTDQVDTGNLFFRGGYHISEIIEIGAEVGFTLFTDDINDIDHDLQTMMVFLKASLPLSDFTSVYVLGGASNVKLSQAIASSSVDFDDDGTAVGIGVQVRNAEGSYFTVDYITYFDEDEFDNSVGDVNVGGINFGFINYF